LRRVFIGSTLAANGARLPATSAESGRVDTKQAPATGDAPTTGAIQASRRDRHQSMTEPLVDAMTAARMPMLR